MSSVRGGCHGSTHLTTHVEGTIAPVPPPIPGLQEPGKGDYASKRMMQTGAAAHSGAPREQGPQCSAE